MRYRKLDANGDYTFGHGSADFLVNSSAAVAQAVQTTLLLAQGEWFLDVTVGVPYNSQILGYNTQSLYDSVIKQVISNVQGFVSFSSYSSTLNPRTRVLTVSAVINTQFGIAQVTGTVAGVAQGGYGVGGYGVGGYGL